jgi:hypothetical protein
MLWHVFLIPTWRSRCRAFSLTLTTTVFSQRSSGWFSACPRGPALEGQQSSISHTAPHLKGLLHDSSFCVRDAMTT